MLLAFPGVMLTFQDDGVIAGESDGRYSLYHPVDTSSAPEPGTLALFGLGLIALVLSRGQQIA